MLPEIAVFDLTRSFKWLNVFHIVTSRILVVAYS